ncbi:MAG: DNA mismatch repair endonuclease MutL [Spirochaetia bacterium]|nr:DNA mismatch repair endonuclease MutL [Spirochaetia bacterium]
MPIHKLPDLIIAQIAAGEVIESPAAVVKELIENSMDARADKIEIVVEDAGLASIQIRDNGTGILREELSLALESFATSKIQNSDDLFNISSMGFRGEALSSIRSVSHVTIESKTAESEYAWKITGEGNLVSKPEPSALPDGTRIIVKNLFYNVPVRKQFLAKEKKINHDILELVTSYATVRPEISFICSIDGKQLIHFPARNSVSERLTQIYENTFMKSMTPLYYKEPSLNIQGYTSGSGFFHSRPVFIKFFVNQRPVHYAPLFKILKRAYGELLPPGKFAAAFLMLEIDPELIDVNVHPQKKEIRFKDEMHINEIIYNAINRALENRGTIDISRKFANLQKAQPDKVGYTPSFLDFSPPLLVKEDAPHIEAGTPSSNIQFFPEIIHSRIFDTFILASSRDGVFLIDQHTAHERIQYESYLEKLKNRKIVRQRLLNPASINVSPSEKKLLQDSMTILNGMGFEIEDFGPAGIKIFSVPEYLAEGEEQEALRTIINIISEQTELPGEVLFDSLAKSLACKSAVKKGDQISLKDYPEIIARLYKCKNPLRCPHGRPTVIHFSKKNIFEFFNRPAPS